MITNMSMTMHMTMDIISSLAPRFQLSGPRPQAAGLVTMMMNMIMVMTTVSSPPPSPSPSSSPSSSSILYHQPSTLISPDCSPKASIKTMIMIVLMIMIMIMLVMMTMTMIMIMIMSMTMIHVFLGYIYSPHYDYARM